MTCSLCAEDHVWLAPADGGRALRLTTDGGRAGHPRLWPDGARTDWTSWRDGGMAMTLRLADDETEALRRRSELEQR